MQLQAYSGERGEGRSDTEEGGSVAADVRCCPAGLDGGGRDPVEPEMQL